MEVKGEGCECITNNSGIAGADGWSLRPLLPGKETLSPRPLLPPKGGA